MLWQQAAAAALAGLLAVALVVPLGWVASVRCSRLGTVGVLIGVVMVTQIVVVLGAGTWFRLRCRPYSPGWAGTR